MYRMTCLIGLSVILAGCATNPLPENYTGPKAQIRDSFANYDGIRADYFTLSQFNGATIPNSLDDSVAHNRGNGLMLGPPREISRFVPAAEGSYTLLGLSHYAAPVQDLIHGQYRVQGEVRFTPEAGATYVIRGVLQPTLAQVWIEDAASGKVVKKIETSTPKAAGAGHEVATP